VSAQGAHTFLLMTHFGLPTEDERTCHQGGWTGALTNLAYRTSHLEPRTSNLEPRTSHLEPRTSNLEPRTS